MNALRAIVREEAAKLYSSLALVRMAMPAQLEISAMEEAVQREVTSTVMTSIPVLSIPVLQNSGALMRLSMDSNALPPIHVELKESALEQPASWKVLKGHAVPKTRSVPQKEPAS